MQEMFIKMKKKEKERKGARNRALQRKSSDTIVEDGCCPFKIVFDEDLYVVFDEDIYVLSMYLCFALRMS